MTKPIAETSTSTGSRPEPNVVTVYGALDDVVEVSGAIEKDFFWRVPATDEDRFLAFSEGTVLRVDYDTFGVLRFTPVACGSAELTVQPAADRATLTGDVRWVVFGTEMAR